MSIRHYLPSTQLIVMVGALTFAGTLVFGAQYITKKPAAPNLAAVSSAVSVAEDADWQKTLDEIQASAGISLPEAPNSDTVNQLLSDVKTSNITDTVARSLLVKLTNAKAQGLGDDVPTQDQLIAQAIQEGAGEAALVSYTQSDLNEVAPNAQSLKAYGNAAASIFNKYPEATMTNTISVVGYYTDYRDSAYKTRFLAISKAYSSLAKDLIMVPVPQTLAPLHLQVSNDLEGMAEAVAEMESMLDDPLRGMAQLQRFESLGGEASRVLTTIAKTFDKNGILFTKDEPGAAWRALVSP